MTWGPAFFYYQCPKCGKKFKYAEDLIPVFGEDFGLCPKCGTPGKYEQDGARIPEDNLYFEVED